MAGLTWSSASTMSPITIVSLPLRLKVAQDVNPIGGVRRTPAALTVRSLRGTETLNVPSFSSSLPLAPVNCSMEAVLSRALGRLLMFWPGTARVGIRVKQMRPGIIFILISALREQPAHEPYVLAGPHLPRRPFQSPATADPSDGRSS